MRRLFTGLAVILLLAVVLQFFLAGSGAFDPGPNDESFGPHRALGYLTLPLALVTVLVGALARIPGRILGPTLLVVGLALLQPVLAAFAAGISDGGTATTAGKVLSGLHAVNGLIVVAVTGNVVRRSRELLKGGVVVESGPRTRESASGTAEFRS
jgi:hypothetical protein